jgi:hypothetical protein
MGNDLDKHPHAGEEKLPVTEPVPRLAKLARSPNTPSKQQRDYNEHVEFTQPNSDPKTD